MTVDTERDIGRPSPPHLTRFLMIALLAPLLLALFSIWLGAEYAKIEAMRVQTRAATTSSALAETLIERLVTAESAQRGFVITGEPGFLDAYAQARTDAMNAFTRLRPTLSDRTIERQRLDTLRGLATRKFAEMDRVIAKRRSDGLDSAAAEVKNNVGKRLMDRIRVVAGQILTAAAHSRDAQAIRYRARVDADTVTIWIGIALVGVAMIGVALGIWRQRMGQYRSRLEAYSVAERNRAILQSTVDAIVIFNPSGTIETVNPAAAEMLGYDTGDLVRRDVSVLMDLVDRPATFHERIGLVDGHLVNPQWRDRKIIHRDGHEIPVDIALGVMRLPDGDYVVASAQDISERKRAERMKDDLISTVSHELRTPLTSVVGALGLLRSGAAGRIAEAPARLIEIAENNSRRLIRLINDMLDIDRIQSGQLKLNRQRIDLRDVAARAAQGSEGAASAAGVTILSDLTETPAPISGDAERLLQVISNLTSNAVRVTRDKGVVRIGVSTTVDGKALVTIDDDGPGVPVDFRDRIFGRFERADGEQGSGTGLGLAISREIVTRHDGRIWFEDRPNGGTRFAFTLDLLRETTRDATAPTGPKVLICEDDDDVAALLRSLMAELGLDADRVATGAAARAALARHDYAALLLDLNLPDENGLNVAQSLRAADGTLALPIIIVSGMSRDGLEGSVPLDIIDWIEKPIDPERLAAAIRTAMARSGKLRPTILHLDDDEDVLLVTEAALRVDANVLKATGLAAASALLETQTIDLVILDLHLDEESGLDLLPMLIDGQGVAIPTIIFSAHDVSADAAKQVDAVFVKSRGSMPDLKETIRRVLSKSGKGS